MPADLTALVTELAHQHDFSGAVRITVDREPVVSAAFGLANRTHHIRNTVDTRFAIASGTKLLTALGIGALIDEGTLALDTRLHDAVSFDLSGIAEHVTIAHLLSHTSGVYDYYDEELIDETAGFDTFELPIAPHKLLRPMDYHPMVVGGAMKFAPGERFSYSNGGYVILGMVIEELAGDYHSFIQSRVLERAGMDASGFFRFDRLPEHTASGYVDTDNGWRSNIYILPIIGGPDGGAYVTVADMEALWRAFLAKEILSPDLTHTFARNLVHCEGVKYYGYGLWLRQVPEQPVVLYIEGCDAGVSFQSSCYGEGTIATVASNTTDGAWPLAKAIDDFLAQ